MAYKIIVSPIAQKEIENTIDNYLLYFCWSEVKTPSLGGFGNTSISEN